MTRLFIELYLDEDVSALLLKLLRSRGSTATSALEAGQLGSSDEAQLSYAVGHQRTVITQYFIDGRKHYGIHHRRSPPASRSIQNSDRFRKTETSTILPG